MANAQIGQSITAAVRALKLIHGDIVALLNSLEAAMLEHGWRNIKDRKKPDLDCDAYVLMVPESMPKKKVSAAIMVSIHCSPSEQFDQPYLLVCAASFKSPTDHLTIWNEWWATGDMSMLEQVVNSSEPVKIPQNVQNQKYLMRTSHAMAFAMPLCDLTGVDDLDRRVVKPALEAASKLGMTDKC